MFVGHLRPSAPLTASLPSSTLSQTTVLCTDPSLLIVESTAWLGFASSSLTPASVNSAIARMLDGAAWRGSA